MSLIRNTPNTVNTCDCPMGHLHPHSETAQQDSYLGPQVVRRRGHERPPPYVPQPAIP